MEFSKPAPSSLAKIELELHPGRSVVRVNGMDLARYCRRVVVEAEGRTSLPVVYLEMVAGDVTINGEGIVHALQPGDAVEALKQLVSHIEPEELEVLVLSKMDGFAGGTGQAMVEALKELADGYGDGT